VSEVKVMLVAFGRAMPLSFDINTVQEGIIRLIPGISDAEVLRWLAERELRPFESVDDFKRRAALTTDCLAGMRF
jgi:predicted nucleic acid-binding OB-fold protein